MRWTPGARPTASASRSTCGTSRSASATTSSRTSSPSTAPAARPNPCMRCNERIKFAAVLEKALDLGFDAVCTGHYAIVRDGASGDARAAPRERRREGPVLRARRADGRAARPHALPARRRRRRRRSCAPRPRRAASPSRTSPTATTSASSPTATRAAGSPSGSAPSAGDDRRPLRRGRRLARGRARLHRRSAPRARARRAGRRRQAAVRARGAPGLEHGRRRPEGSAGDRRDRGGAVHLGRARARRLPTSRATCRSARTPTRCPRARVLADGIVTVHARDARSTASPRARRRCSTTARACSASSRSTAPSRRSRRRLRPRPLRTRVGTRLLD